ncbi:MAG: hypothetical protein KF773_39470, partial [Deltaproteobacteria bacterium]|nr:hypothetical protein [Deltaproteobacteria bacterium]
AGRAASSALVSGRAVDGPAGTDAAFAWAGAADRDDLLAWIDATGAARIFVTGPCAGAVVEALGPRARALGPPRQMTLFPGEA